MREKYIVFSYDPDGEDDFGDGQIMVDVVPAHSPAEAVDRVKYGRPCADVTGAHLLADYVQRLIGIMAEPMTKTEEDWCKIRDESLGKDEGEAEAAEVH